MKNYILIPMIFLFALALPSHSRAQVMFGGLDVFEMPCTCSPFTYHVFAPLYIATPVPVSGALAVSYTPNIFLFYYLHPGAWALGTFTPGTEACWMYAGWSCFPLPVLGTINPTTGSSL